MRELLFVTDYKPEGFYAPLHRRGQRVRFRANLRDCAAALVRAGFAVYVEQPKKRVYLRQMPPAKLRPELEIDRAPYPPLEDILRWAERAYAAREERLRGERPCRLSSL